LIEEPEASREEGRSVTTLTKHTAEELSDYLREVASTCGLHSEIDAIERVEILRALRKGELDVGRDQSVAGRAGSPGSLVAILDADKEGIYARRPV
jgi:excinuclease ABC subunit B